MKILFGVFATILLIMTLGEKTKEKQKNYTLAYAVTILGILAVYLLG